MEEVEKLKIFDENTSLFRIKISNVTSYENRFETKKIIIKNLRWYTYNY
jgi:hypothetical protein